VQSSIHSRRAGLLVLRQTGIQRAELRGLKPPPEKSAQKFLGLPFCCTVEHVQLKNLTVDVMNIVVTITVGVKMSSRMHENAPF